MDRPLLLSGLCFVIYIVLFFTNGLIIRPFDLISVGLMIIISLIGIIFSLKSKTKMAKWLITSLHLCALILACLVLLSLGISEA